MGTYLGRKALPHDHPLYHGASIVMVLPSKRGGGTTATSTEPKAPPPGAPSCRPASSTEAPTPVIAKPTHLVTEQESTLYRREPVLVEGGENGEGYRGHVAAAAGSPALEDHLDRAPCRGR